MIHNYKVTCEVQQLNRGVIYLYLNVYKNGVGNKMICIDSNLLEPYINIGNVILYFITKNKIHTYYSKSKSGITYDVYTIPDDDIRIVRYVQI